MGNLEMSNLKTPTFSKIAVIGTHGAGKSTLCYLVAAHYKSKGKNVDLIQERIRFSPFPYNEKMTEDTALWAYHTQVVRELESKAKGFDIAVCDRSALDCFFYASYWLKNTPLTQKLWSAVALDWMPRYDLVIYVSPDVPLQGDGIRSEDNSFQLGIDSAFWNYIQHRMDKGLNTSIVNSSEIFNKTIDFEELLNDA